MSNLMINWRVWRWHWQVVQRSDWRGYRLHGMARSTLSYNPYHRNPAWPPIAIYEGRRYALAVAIIAALTIWIAL